MTKPTGDQPAPVEPARPGQLRTGPGMSPPAQRHRVSPTTGRTGSSSSARATSACHSRCGRSRSATTSSASISTPSGSSSWPPAAPTSRTSPTHRLEPGPRSGRYEPTDDPDRLAGFDVAVIDVPTPLHDGVPNLSFVEEAAAACGPPPPRRGHGGPGVDELPGDHRGAGGTHPRGGVGPGGRIGLPPRLQPRADRPRQRDLEPREHPQGGLGHRRGLAAGRARRSTTGSSSGPSRCRGPARPS